MINTNCKTLLATFLVAAILCPLAASAAEVINPSLAAAPAYGLEKSMVPASGGDGAWDEAARLVVETHAPNRWDAQLVMPTTAPVGKEDIVTVSLWLRGGALPAAEGAGLVELGFEKSGEPYTKSLAYPVEVTPEWRKVETRFRSEDAYPAGGAQFGVKIGFRAQWVEVAGVVATNHGTGADYGSLPETPVTYAGRGADAAWRSVAEARIEQIRKGDLRIIVVDDQGQRVPGAKVRVQQQRHAFAFGTAVAVGAVMQAGDDGERYREWLSRYFNSVTFENALKWKAWDAGWSGTARTLDALAWLHEQGYEVRGHNMIWPGWRNLPDSLKALADQPDVLRARALDHIAEVAGATRGYVGDWDVVNELFDNTDLTDILGRDEPIAWFKAARSYLPATRLYYNDYAALVQGGLDTAHKRHFEKTVRHLIDGGAPIDGLGLQGHFGMLLTPPEALITELDRWAAFGLDLRVTEFDVAMEDEQLQGDYTRDFLTALFSHEAVVGVSTWGFWAKRHWEPEAAFLREDWSERPAGKIWRELTRGTWWTDTEAVTDETGEVVVRAFLGRHTVRIGDRHWHTDLPRGGGVVTVIRE